MFRPIAFASALALFVIVIVLTHAALDLVGNDASQTASRTLSPGEHTGAVARQPSSRYDGGPTPAPESGTPLAVTTPSRSSRRPGSGGPTRSTAPHRAAGGGTQPTATPVSVPPPQQVAFAGFASAAPVSSYSYPAYSGAALPIATATPVGNAISLRNYWIDPAHMRPGETLSLHYVVDNGSGTTQRAVLGASIKGMGTGSWTTSAISDPPHDVVAILPPGTSVHLRYFRVPLDIAPGRYDVAWGLLSPLTRQRIALVTTNGGLTVQQ